MTTRTTANASATRGFFVNMLVRDISVEGAVLDLIDNAVDAAYAHSKADGRLGGFRIEITLGQNSFKISDNCRGMDIDTATNYAFRFGRADDFNPNTRIGEFGIGMKRAVFRLGRNFMIDSSTDQTRFVVDVDVEQWQNQDGDWTFPMTIEDSPSEESGTTIIVNNLNAGVKELFGPARKCGMRGAGTGWGRHEDAAGFEVGGVGEPVGGASPSRLLVPSILPLLARPAQ